MSQAKTYHHGDLRRTLLNEAALMIREEGEAGLSMRGLASRAGVSRTAPYHHFKDKQDLLCSVAEEGFNRYIKVLSLAEGDFTEQGLQKFVLGYLEFATCNTEYYDLMFSSQLWKSDDITESLKSQAHGSFRFYLEQVRGWQKQGLIDPELDVLRYSQVSWSTLHGMSRLIIDGVYPNLEAIGPMCEHAATMFWRLLQPTG